MSRRKVDNRVRILLENGVISNYRSLFVIVGDKSCNQVIYLHHILSKTSLKQANILWCYSSRKDLHFSSHREKRLKQLKAKHQFGKAQLNEDDPLEMFVAMTEIRYCYYHETHKILGNTFKMCVLQNFEAITPNILCRAIETVEGGGVIVLLLESLTSLKQLYSLNMDVHSRYRTAFHQSVVPRFNERFILSLASCESCLVMNDLLQVLPISSLTREIEPLDSDQSDGNRLSKRELDLKALKESNKDVEPLGTLVGLCKTYDQGKVVCEFISAITEKTLASTITLTAARGRGKSAAMGLALAGAISIGYSNMYVTSPSPENLNALFEFLLKGLDALGYEKHLHYQTIVSSDPQHGKAIMRLIVNKDHRQIVQYISPWECEVLDNAELVVIDEAAAIPLPQVQALLGPYLVFLASTISGYEGTGRSLSLKLIKQLREQSQGSAGDSKHKRKLIELGLKESIRYKNGDHVEKWLYDLLCLESPAMPVKDVPEPKDCQLFYVNRDTLFGYHKISEKFLKMVMTLLVSSHYRNTPDDLQTLSDAPAHHLFVLLPPTPPKNGIPQVFCVIQVALEGKISKVAGGLENKKAAGDLIPWTVSNLFQDDDFIQLSGARIVRIATHPDLQGRGFGSRAMELLEEYYNRSAWKASTENIIIPKQASAVSVVKEEEVGLLDEKIEPRELGQPLLLSMSEREPEPLHYLGVSFGSSYPLLRFWKRAGFSCIYLSQVKNNLTGEHTCLLLKVLNEPKSSRSDSWLSHLWFDYRRRMLNLLPGVFRGLDSQFALSLITNKIYKKKSQPPSKSFLNHRLSRDDLTRLDSYTRHQCGFPLIVDILPRVSAIYFQDKLPNCKLKAIQTAILVGVGIQKKSPSNVAKELGLGTSILMSQIHTLISELSQRLEELWSTCEGNEVTNAECTEEDKQQELNKMAAEITAEVSAEIVRSEKSVEEERERGHVTDNIDLTQFAIKGIEMDVEKTKLNKKKRLKLEKKMAEGNERSTKKQKY